MAPWLKHFLCLRTPNSFPQHPHKRRDSNLPVTLALGRQGWSSLVKPVKYFYQVGELWVELGTMSQSIKGVEIKRDPQYQPLTSTSIWTNNPPTPTHTHTRMWASCTQICIYTCIPHTHKKVIFSSFCLHLRKSHFLVTYIHRIFLNIAGS